MHLPEIDIQAAIELLTFIGALVAGVWRVSYRLKQALDGQKAQQVAIDKIPAIIGQIARRITQDADKASVRLHAIEKEINAFSIILHEREKDVSRVEGQIEQLSTVVIKQVAAVRDSVASLDAIWRTLQVLHPDAVPKRASDRK